MEFMAYFGILLLIFVAFSPIIFMQTSTIRNKSVDVEAGRLATTLEKEINSAVRFGDGYSRNFTMPDDLSGRKYEVDITDTEGPEVLRVRSEDVLESRSLIATDIKGVPEPGINTVRNTDGEIIFEKT